MTLNMFAVVIDCTDPRLQANFWAEVLSYDVRERNPDEYLVSDPTGTAFAAVLHESTRAQGGQESIPP